MFSLRPALTFNPSIPLEYSILYFILNHQETQYSFVNIPKTVKIKSCLIVQHLEMFIWRLEQYMKRPRNQENVILFPLISTLALFHVLCLNFSLAPYNFIILVTPESGDLSFRGDYKVSTFSPCCAGLTTIWFPNIYWINKYKFYGTRK